MTRVPTFGDAVRNAKGGATGFDYLRLGLALYVLLWHCVSVSDLEASKSVWMGAFGPFHRSVLPMFFALSGFLVAGSFARNTIPAFIALRALRIVPALAVEVALTALVIGAAFTTLPLADYFGSEEFWAYFLNVAGDIHFTLPGVFDGSAINSQLWTIPVEFQCYLALVVLGVIGLGAKRDLFVILTLSAILLLTYTAVRNDLVKTGPAAPSLALVLSFLCGVCGYMYKDVIPRRGALLAACAVASYGCLYAGNLVFLSPLPIAYVTIFVGLAKLPRLKWGDLSYGLYLFNNPVIACVFFMTGRNANWEFLLAVGLPLTLAFAYLSWTLIERPILTRKQDVLRIVERAFGKISPRLFAAAALTRSRAPL